MMKIVIIPFNSIQFFIIYSAVNQDLSDDEDRNNSIQFFIIYSAINLDLSDDEDRNNSIQFNSFLFILQ
jgi:hypothetical protein